MAKTRKDGRKCATFTFEGKRYYCYGATIKEAKAASELKKQELKDSKYKKSSNCTLDEYHARWEEARYGIVKESTIYKQSFQYKTISNTVIDNAGTRLGSMLIGDIEVQNVRDLQKILSKSYTTNGTNNTMNHLKNIMQDALNERAIEMNPCNFVKPLKRVEVEARDTIHRALTIEETKKFFEVATGSWYYNVFCFMINTGMRLGEVGGLTLADIKKDRVEVRRTIQRTSLGLIIGKDTKSRAGIRDIPMTDGIRKAIENQKIQNSFAFSDRVVDINKPLFTSSDGTIISASAVDRSIDFYCKKAGIEKFTSHAFRDTFATRALESGMQPKTLQEILGHSNIGITMNLYAHVMEDTKQNEMNQVVIAI